jgi:hypothetical protein
VRWPALSRLSAPRIVFGDLDKDAMRMGYAKFFSRSHNAVIRVYDEAGNVLENA